MWAELPSVVGAWFACHLGRAHFPPCVVEQAFCAQYPDNYLSLCYAPPLALQLPASLRLEPLKLSGSAVLQLAAGANLPESTVEVLSGAGQRMSRALIAGHRQSLRLVSPGQQRWAGAPVGRSKPGQMLPPLFATHLPAVTCVSFLLSCHLTCITGTNPVLPRARLLGPGRRGGGSRRSGPCDLDCCWRRGRGPAGAAAGQAGGRGEWCRRRQRQGATRPQAEAGGPGRRGRWRRRRQAHGDGGGGG
jgi:hypothetical protein